LGNGFKGRKFREFGRKDLYMSLPVLTRSLAYKLDMMDAYFVEKRMSGIAGTEIKWYLETLALMAKGNPNDQFNSIRGFMKENESLLDEMLSLYQGQKVRLDILPSELTPDISAKLIQHNLTPKSFHTVFYRDCTKLKPLETSEIQVRKISADELGVFLDTYLSGFGLPESFLAGAKEQRSFWMEVPEFHLYIATIKDTPVGASVLYIKDDIGYLAGASTLPDYRGVGCQYQQLVKRINDAADLGCTILTTQAAFDSSSQRNMQRAGFQVAFTKGIWSN
jgi:hypothetical protein